MFVLLRVLCSAAVFFFLLSSQGYAATSQTDAALNKAPAGMSETTETFPALMASHAKAIGKRVPRSVTAQWTILREGVASAEKLVRNGADYVSTITKGSISNTYGQFLGHAWHRDANGIVFPTSTVDDGSFAMYRVLADAEDPKNDVKVAGKIGNAYVVEVKNSSWKHPEWVYYDAKSFLVSRTERIEDGERIISTYDDYRLTDGVEQPWHVHDSSGDVAYDVDYRQTALSYTPVDPGQFGVPPSSVAFATVDKHYELPAHFIDGDIIVRLVVNGRGLDFKISSGMSQSIIDSEVARELGLPTFGHVRRIAGHDVSYDTVLQSASIGDLQLHNFAVRALPFHYHAREDVKVVGLLGADFLSSGEVHIDYVNGLIALDPESAFHPAIAVAGYPSIPITFDDGQPYIEGSIADHIANHMLLDNGYYFSIVTGAITRNFPSAVPDLHGHKHANVSVPFANKKAYGRDVDIWMANISDILIGPVHFKNYRMIATDSNFHTSGYTPDVVVGSDFLHLFDVYLDYQKSRLFLKPNKWFARIFRSGP